jgi:hypothetical protein
VKTRIQRPPVDLLTDPRQRREHAKAMPVAVAQSAVAQVARASRVSPKTFAPTRQSSITKQRQQSSSSVNYHQPVATTRRHESVVLPKNKRKARIVRLTPQLDAAVEALIARTGVSFNELVRSFFVELCFSGGRS